MLNTFPDLSIEKLLSDSQYVVPRYQRNYAWAEEQIKQLIDDILDNTIKENQGSKPYYLGTLVVFPRPMQENGILYEIIDGQQRFTTLTLMASFLTFSERVQQDGNQHWFSEINLGFKSRRRSSVTLLAAHNGAFHDNGHNVGPRTAFTEEIVDAYDIIQRLLPQSCQEKKIEEKVFKDYFFSNVRICRVTVPEDTSLNHYFEIMNNRGEQLEKHEVLKARLVKKLEPGAEQFVFNKIWESCSSMDKYIQYGFPKNIRGKLFGSFWDSFEPETADKLFSLLFEFHRTNGSGTDNANNLALDQLISKHSTGGFQNKKNQNSNEEEEPERFNSIINFQNFLPHVLSVFLKDGSIALDDKQLLKSFDTLVARGAAEIKAFGYALLKSRFLFDQYIIKRDATEDEREWSLKELHLTDQGNPSYHYSFSKEDELQKEITLLQSMFHVSIPSRPYKYWLQGALRYLNNIQEITSAGFRDYLREQARAFVYNRFLASTPLEYDELIFTNLGEPVETQLNLEKTRYGSIENILLFNFIDYLMWTQKKDEDHKIKDFVYTFRSSVEHYYPQNPIDGNALSDNEVLHSIGNLCLISNGKNSMLRHHLPKAKAEFYLKQNYIDSVLQHEMLLKAEYWSNTPVEAIKNQERTVIELLKKNRP